MENVKVFSFPKRIVYMGVLAELVKTRKGIATYELEESGILLEVTPQKFAWLEGVGYIERA